MGYFAEIKAVVIYVESHIQEKQGEIVKALPGATGFSVAHLRDIFCTQTGMPLLTYIRNRKLVNSAFDLLHSDNTILEIAIQYGFSSHETYTRAFKRMTGITPYEFRKQRCFVGKAEIYNRVYGLALSKEGANGMNKEKVEKEDSTVLYGVPKVEYGRNCTPYPLCLQACASYLGEDIDYCYVMAATGAAFRLTWNTECWDLGNVDIYHTLNDSNDIYEEGATALGREFFYKVRTKDTTKESFMEFVKERIDQGFPCIALGIIGPPEACIITGYKEEGKVLMGWNFFQNSPDFSGHLTFEDCGYFNCDSWWENKDTHAVMSLGEAAGEKKTPEEIVSFAIKIISGRKEGDYAKGIVAYDAWKEAVLTEEGFYHDAPLSLLYERIGCIDDAMSSLLDGRGCAAGYFYRLSKTEMEKQVMYEKIAYGFQHTFEIVEKMSKLLWNWDRREERIREIADYKLRQQLSLLIDQAKASDEETLKLLRAIE